MGLLLELGRQLADHINACHGRIARLAARRSPLRLMRSPRDRTALTDTPWLDLIGDPTF